MDAVAAAGPDVAFDVCVDAVGESGVGIGKDPAVGEVFVVGNVVGVNGRGAGEVAVELLGARVADVEGFEVWGEFEAVGLEEAVGYDGEFARRWVEAVDLLDDSGSGAEVLEEAVVSIGEPDFARLWVLARVVDAAEVAAIVRGQNRPRVARYGVDGDEGRVVLKVALVAEEEVRGGGVGAVVLCAWGVVGCGAVWCGELVVAG